MVLDYRLIIGRSMSPNFDDSAYRVVNVWRGFWALSIKILVLPRPTSYMLTSFMFYFLNFEDYFIHSYKWIR